jgi:hypothetical protein
MKNIICSVAAILVAFSANAVDINTCPQNTRDIMTDITNMTTASQGFYSQLGDQRSNAIVKLAQDIATSAANCESVVAPLKNMDDNFLVLFNVKN